MSDYESRWRGDQGYRRDDDRDRWGMESRGERNDGRERQGRYEHEYGASDREPGQERDYGRDMLDDMRRYARGDYGRNEHGQGYGGARGSSGWERSGGRPSTGFGAYGGEEHGQSGHGRGDYGRGGRDERGFFERAGDEIATWFGDDDAERRRHYDAERGDAGAQHHRGRGPRGYTRSDDRIREDVNDRLTDDTYIDASEIDVTVSSCEVTLNGTVDSRAAKRRAEDIAESVSGVKHVQNNLRVQQPSYAGTGTTAGASAMAGLGTGTTTGTSGAQTTTGASRTGTTTR